MRDKDVARSTGRIEPGRVEQAPTTGVSTSAPKIERRGSIALSLSREPIARAAIIREARARCVSSSITRANGETGLRTGRKRDRAKEEQERENERPKGGTAEGRRAKKS